MEISHTWENSQIFKEVLKQLFVLKKRKKVFIWNSYMNHNFFFHDIGCSKNTGWIQVRVKGKRKSKIIEEANGATWEGRTLPQYCHYLNFPYELWTIINVYLGLWYLWDFKFEIFCQHFGIIIKEFLHIITWCV